METLEELRAARQKAFEAGDVEKVLALSKRISRIVSGRLRETCDKMAALLRSS